MAYSPQAVQEYPVESRNRFRASYSSSTNELQQVLIKNLRRLFANSLKLNINNKEDTQIFRLHINSANINIAIKWLIRGKPIVCGFSYKINKSNVIKLKVQMLNDQYIPVKLLDHSFNNV